MFFTTGDFVFPGRFKSPAQTKVMSLDSTSRELTNLLNSA